MVTSEERFKDYYSYYYHYYYQQPRYENCSYYYPNNTQTWIEDNLTSSSDSRTDLRGTYSCNATIPVTVNGKTYDADDLDGGYGYCYNSVGYDSSYLIDKSRCLPDTANPSYQWGFATLMSGLFIFVTAAWTLSMYVLWQDAQFNCKLVKEGYRLTPLRAAFAMVVAARRRTGLGGKGLVRAKTGGLERELFGKKGTRGTVIEGHLFVENPEDGEEDGLRTPESPREPLSPPSPAFTPGKERDKCWPVSPSSVEDHEIKSLVRSDTDISFHVLDDEELRKRYLRGAEEARLSRKPLSRESTWVEESMWERGRDGQAHDSHRDDHDDDNDDDGEDGEKKGDEKQDSGKGKGKSRNRLKKTRRSS
jgi:hypothetical protein